MITNIPELIEYCSTILDLQPGDVIVAGTPAGVGLKRNPPLFIKAGDVAEVEIESIGCLRNSIIPEN
jgi:2-keto-4-pentenoate hydratase/2-oxohepta-3-ene-1,7-dioic acid hydratase in catechol pathway